MAFPTTGILDNFNRNNEGPPPSASWSAMYSGLTGGWEVVSNQCTVDSLGVAGACANYWNQATYADSEVYTTIVTKPADTTYFILFARAVDVTGTTPDGYVLRLATVAGAGNDVVTFRRSDNAVQTQLGDAITQEVAAGNSFGLEIISDDLTAYLNTGSWASIGTRTDATYSAAGYLCITTTSTATVLDNFGGGTVVAAVPGSWMRTIIRSSSSGINVYKRIED